MNPRYNFEAMFPNQEPPAKDKRLLVLADVSLCYKGEDGRTKCVKESLKDLFYKRTHGDATVRAISDGSMISNSKAPFWWKRGEGRRKE